MTTPFFFVGFAVAWLSSLDNVVVAREADHTGFVQVQLHPSTNDQSAPPPPHAIAARLAKPADIAAVDVDEDAPQASSLYAFSDGDDGDDTSRRRVSRRRRRRRTLCDPPDNWLTKEKPEKCLKSETDKVDKNTAITDHFRYLKELTPQGRVILFFGSFLGWYRECGVLSSDHDIDIVLFPDDFNRLDWAQLMSKLGLPATASKLQTIAGVAAKHFVRAPRGEVDVWVMNQNASHYIVLHPSKTRTYVFPKEYKGINMIFQPVKINGIDVYAPYPAEPWAEVMFGKTWATPQDHDGFDSGDRLDLKSVVTTFELPHIESADCIGNGYNKARDFWR